MDISPEDRTWLQRQILNYPNHWGLSVCFYIGVYSFARFVMHTNIHNASVWALLGLFCYAFVAEINQHIIKSEYGIKLIDIVDAVLDWVSWVFFPMLLTGAIGRF